MTVILKPKAEITVPKSIRRKAGIKPGDRVEFSVSGRVINIIPKRSPDELQDEREIQDPKVPEHIRKSHADYLAGRSRPAKEFLAELRAEASPRAKKKRHAPDDASAIPGPNLHSLRTPGAAAPEVAAEVRGGVVVIEYCGLEYCGLRREDTY
jgi:AbrB family looped-hinge helix DNA binding protein